MSTSPQRDAWLPVAPVKRVLAKPSAPTSAPPAPMSGSESAHPPQQALSPLSPDKEQETGKAVWSCSSSSNIASRGGCLKIKSPLLGARRQGAAKREPGAFSLYGPGSLISGSGGGGNTSSGSTGNTVGSAGDGSRRRSTRRSMRRSLWTCGSNTVSINASNAVGLGIEEFPGVTARRRFDEVSARLLEEMYKSEAVFARCTELLKTWFYVPLRAALGPHAEGALEKVFCGINALEQHSRDVLKELGSIARSGRPFLLAETYGGCEEYLKAHEKFVGGHRAGLAALTDLMNKDNTFVHFLKGCSTACGGVDLFDVYWVVLQRLCTVCKLATAHNTLVNAVNAIHGSINSCNAFLAAHSPFPCAPTSHRVAKAGPTKPAAAAGYARLLALQHEAQSLCNVHASIAAFRSITQDAMICKVPLSIDRHFLSSVPVVLIRKPFYGCTTEMPAELIAFEDGIALCTPAATASATDNSSKSPSTSAEKPKMTTTTTTTTTTDITTTNAQRALIQWYPAKDIRATTPCPPSVEGNDDVFNKDNSSERIATKALTSDDTMAAAAAAAISNRVTERKLSFMISSPSSYSSSTAATLTGSSGSTTTTSTSSSSSAVAAAAAATTPLDNAQCMRALNKEDYATCERLMLEVTEGKHGIDVVHYAESGANGGAGSTSGNPAGSSASSGGQGESTAVFGRELDSLLAQDQRVHPGLRVPVLPQRLCHYVLAHGLGEQGIFRVAAGKRIMDAVCKRINNGELDAVDFGEDTVHLASSLLKTFFRDMPTPLIPPELYAAFTAVGALDGIEDSVKAEAAAAASRNKRAVLRDLISRIPRAGRDLLCESMAFYNQIAANSHVNCMDAGNLAIVTAPNILYVRDGRDTSFPSISSANNVVAYMIANSKDLFDVPRPAWLAFKRKLVGHTKSASAICITPADTTTTNNNNSNNNNSNNSSSRHVITADASGKCFVWDAAAATYIRSLDLSVRYPTAAIIIGTNMWLGTADAIHILDSATFAPVSAAIPVRVYSFTMAEDGAYVWCGAQGKVVVISVADFSVVAELPVPDNADIFVMTRIPGTDTMWGAGYSKTPDKSIYVWDTVERSLMGQFPAHKRRINAITPAGPHIWTASDDGTICAWDPDTGKLAHTITHHIGPVYGLCALEDQVWSSSWDKTICVWDPETFDFLAEIKGYHTDSIIYLFPVRNTGSVDIWSCSSDKALCVWNVLPRSAGTASAGGASLNRTK